MNETNNYIVIFVHPDNLNVRITERVEALTAAYALSEWTRRHEQHTFVPIYVVPTESGKEVREVRKISVPKYHLT